MPAGSVLSRRIRERRKMLGLSQRDLAGITGISQGAISQYEVGEVSPNADILINLAHTLQTSIDWLLGLTNEIEPVKDDGLTPIERETLRSLRGFTEDQQRLVLEMLETIQRMIPHNEH